MTVQFVDPSVLYSPEAEHYFCQRANDRRILTGFRATMDMLGLPLPDWAIRRKPGRTPGRNVLIAYNADNPTPLITTLAPRRPNASPSTVANARG